MKIAFDISQIIYGTGVSHYRANLIKNLLDLDKENQYLLYGLSLRRSDELKKFTESLGSGAEVKIFPFPQRLLHLIWNKLHIFPLEKLIGKVDLIHTSDWLEPPSVFAKVTTVHDLAPLKFPRITPKAVVAVHKNKLSLVRTESEKVIVPSECTKNDLIDFGVEEGSIVVIPEANNLTKTQSSSVVDVQQKYKIFGKYLIAIGVGARKNTEKIIDAYKLSQAGKDLKLVIVGGKPGIRLSQTRGVRYLGYVNDNDLSALLTGAEALVFPSLYEGFGVPILDSFACETPVVTSNISSMPEVAGDAAILVDPTDTRSIAQGIEEALSKPKTLIAKGIKQLEKYSWKETAQKTLDVYKSVVNN
ncbi:glycosyltransferase family 4 protein [Candidatus Microgenomates bacterium]|nr:glycosyltransferase family 4 protein [Candidatus Microgenomates bacterium]